LTKLQKLLKKGYHKEPEIQNSEYAEHHVGPKTPGFQPVPLEPLDSFDDGYRLKFL
jgi:hypothetical protein